ncbi:MAG: WGR domain-containing protein [Gammaproteobacteria bacterium]|nr:WGR domain-containing protein [Gammaproteobacteria bacterium]MDH5801735.1 WGR domain-containing protein [Gammaproteobacteria bacterium]
MRIYLQTRAEPDKAPRFYHIWLQQDLIEGWTLVTESGQQGSSGRVSRRHFQHWEEAEQAMQDCRDRQINRGYTVVFVQGQERR